MGKLRDQMVSDLVLRNYGPRTVEAYTWCMLHFVKHFGRSPDLMGEADIQKFPLHLIEEREASPSLRKMFVAGIKFFLSLYSADGAGSVANGSRCTHVLPYSGSGGGSGSMGYVSDPEKNSSIDVPP